MARSTKFKTGRLLVGDCRERLAALPDASVDAIVTDPPYELGFMGKKWDASGIAYDAELWSQCLRVLKPGGHLLAFGGTRTYHRMVVAIEDAGFEIRDSLHWVYGTGFPKSLDVSKAIDKRRDDRADIETVVRWMEATRAASGTTRKQVEDAFGTVNIGQALFTITPGCVPRVPTLEQVPVLLKLFGLTLDDVPDEIRALLWDLNGRKGQPGENWFRREPIGTMTVRGEQGTAGGYANGIASHNHDVSTVRTIAVTAAATDASSAWEGWGTALKPAHEPIVLARKPLAGTVADTVLEYGTGALNIGACRVGGEVETWPTSRSRPPNSTNLYTGRLRGLTEQVTVSTGPPPPGRWPANILFTHDAQCTTSCAPYCPTVALDAQAGTAASRFFSTTAWDPTYDSPTLYVPKPTRRERDAGLEDVPKRRSADRTKDDGVGGDNPRNRSNTPQANHHPTVKPVALMRHLVRLITPPGGTVLDPFLGSGTTAVAAILEGFTWVGCEMTEDYLPIISARVKHAQKQPTASAQPDAAQEPAAADQDGDTPRLPGL